MKTNKSQTYLSRQEHQIIGYVYRHGQATLLELMENIPNAASETVLQQRLEELENKGYLQHKQRNGQTIYSPIPPSSLNQKKHNSSFKHLLQTFLERSTEQAVTAQLDVSEFDLSEEELDKLLKLIDQVKKEGR